jgi:transposase
MQSLARHYHQMLGLNDEWAIDNVELDMESQTLSLALEFVGSTVKCPDCSTLCARKDKARERTWRHLDASRFRL